VRDLHPATDALADPQRLGQRETVGPLVESVVETATVHVLHGDPGQLLTGVDDTDDVLGVGPARFLPLAAVDSPPGGRLLQEFLDGRRFQRAGVARLFERDSIGGEPPERVAS
jgi:hypothetical protein